MEIRASLESAGWGHAPVPISGVQIGKGERIQSGGSPRMILANEAPWTSVGTKKKGQATRP